MDNTILFSGVYGFLQLSMRDVGMLLEGGAWHKKKKHLSMIEQDAIFIYEWIEDRLRPYPIYEIRKKTAVINGMVKKLLNDSRYINNFMLGIYIMRDWTEEVGSRVEQDMLLPKINRIIEALDEEMMGERFDPQIKKTTARVANNIFRQWAGKPQLSDEVRDAKFKRILKRT